MASQSPSGVRRRHTVWTCTLQHTHYWHHLGKQLDFCTCTKQRRGKQTVTTAVKCVAVHCFTIKPGAWQARNQFPGSFQQTCRHLVCTKNGGQHSCLLLWLTAPPVHLRRVGGAAPVTSQGQGACRSGAVCNTSSRGSTTNLGPGGGRRA